MEAESRGRSADVERRVEWMEGWERRVRRRVGREVEVGEGGVVRRMSGASRMRRILGEGVEVEERSLVRDWWIRGWEVERLGGEEGDDGEGEGGVQELFR